MEPFSEQPPELVQYEILKYICEDLHESDVLPLRLISKKYAYGIFSNLILKNISLKLKDDIPSCLAPEYWRDNFNKVKGLNIEICKRIKFLNIYYPTDHLTIESVDYIELKKLYVSKKVKKLRLYYTSVNDYYDVHTDNVEIYGGTIANVDTLKYKKTLMLVSCNRVIDVSPLANIRTLSLIRVDNITDVSSLKDVYELKLTELGKVTDVSMLKNHKLELMDMRNVYNVSSLSSVHDLTIIGLPITSVDGLENVERLELRRLTNVDTSKLKNKVLIIKDMITTSLSDQTDQYDQTDQTNQISYYQFGLYPDLYQPSGHINMTSHINIGPTLPFNFTYSTANNITNNYSPLIVTSVNINYLRVSSGYSPY